MRQIVLDTETTGLEPSEGHRIIEIGCVELINRRLTGEHYHVYINPERNVDEGAFKVHGISDEFLRDKPIFQEIVHDFLEYIGNSELIIHNASFDMGFINHELKLAKNQSYPLEKICPVLDTLIMAREKHPRQKNNLDALCKRYDIDNSKRDLHGALLDSKILALVYLAMTGGQEEMFSGDGDHSSVESISSKLNGKHKVEFNRTKSLKIIQANQNEVERHLAFLKQNKIMTE